MPKKTTPVTTVKNERILTKNQIKMGFQSLGLATQQQRQVFKWYWLDTEETRTSKTPKFTIVDSMTKNTE